MGAGGRHQGLFDEISHTALMDRFRVRIKDKRICALVKAFLKSGIMTEPGVREETLTGTPQGGILSPLLSNVALSALDDYFDQQWRIHMGTRLLREKRYADDLVLMVAGEKHHAEALREEVAAILISLGLRLAPEMKALISSDSLSAGCGNEGRKSATSIRSRPRKRYKQSRTR